MANGLFSDYNPQTLQDVLGQQAQAQTAQTTDQYTQAKKRAVAGQAASGRLMSGVSDYPLGDLNAQEGQALSGIQSNLATSLGGIPSEDWLNQKNFQRSYDLANLIGSLNKPSTLDQVFQGIGSIGPLAAVGASFL
jgi:hypothetical protein